MSSLGVGEASEPSRPVSVLASPLPCLTLALRRALSIRMCRIVTAAVARKWLRSFHLSLAADMRIHASWTSIVGWKVQPPICCLMRRAASLRSSAYTSGSRSEEPSNPQVFGLELSRSSRIENAQFRVGDARKVAEFPEHIRSYKMQSHSSSRVLLVFSQ